MSNALRSIAGIARADFRERTRRYSFLLALLFAIFLGYAAATGKLFLQFDDYRGVYTSAWIGALVTLVITCFVSLVGFYIVKNAVERDRFTSVGQIIAATPVSRPTYAFGKFLSNFAVLGAMVAVLAVAALVMQFVAAEDREIHLWALLSPFLLLALPTMALTAACALCFEMLPLLRGGFGNVAWFFVWTFSIAAPGLSGKLWLDPTGIFTVMNSLGAEAARHVPNYHGGMAFQLEVGQHINVVQSWRFAGIAWTAQAIALRAMWIGVACVMVVLAALVFDRFDTAAAVTARRRGGRPAVAPGGPVVQDAVSAVAPAMAGTPVHLTPLSEAASVHRFGRIFAAELRLALFGQRWWWYAVAMGLLIAQFAAPLEASRGPLVATSWMWCVLVWSAMGARETRFNTRPLLFCCANVLPGQFAACLAAGWCVALLCGVAAGVRLAIAGNFAGLLGWLAGALFLPSLALFLGVLSGTGKPFEGMLTMVWYVGPMNHTPGFDFTGSANGTRTVAWAAVYLSLAAVCVLCAYAIRARQLLGPD